MGTRIVAAKSAGIALLIAGALWLVGAKGKAKLHGDALGGRAIASASEAANGSPEVPADEARYLKLFNEDKPPIEQSRQLEAAIRASLNAAAQSSRGGAVPVLTVDSVECRLQLCRISLRFDSIASDIRIVADVFTKPYGNAYPNGFGAFHAPPRVTLPDGRIRTRLYLAREGNVTLPS